MNNIAPTDIMAARAKLGASAGHIEGAMEAVAPYLAELTQKVAALERRLAELEAKQAEFRYRGVWKNHESYKVGNSCTDGGSVFICKRDNQGQRPGTTDDWQLAVRRGQDSKDLQRGTRV